MICTGSAVRGSAPAFGSTSVTAASPVVDTTAVDGTSTLDTGFGRDSVLSALPVRNTRPPAPRWTATSRPVASVTASLPGTARRTRIVSLSWSMNTTPPSASAARLNGTPLVPWTSRSFLPSPLTLISPTASATTNPSSTGVAEVTWALSSVRGLTCPFAASTTRTPVLPRSSSPSCVSAAVSPLPQPGLKYASDVRTARRVTAPESRSTTAVKPPRLASCWLLVNVRGAYTATARLPDPVTHTLPIHWSASTPGTSSVAAVRQV